MRRISPVAGFRRLWVLLVPGVVEELIQLPRLNCCAGRSSSALASWPASLAPLFLSFIVNDSKPLDSLRTSLQKEKQGTTSTKSNKWAGIHGTSMLGRNSLPPLLWSLITFIFAVTILRLRKSTFVLKETKLPLFWSVIMIVDELVGSQQDQFSETVLAAYLKFLFPTRRPNNHPIQSFKEKQMTTIIQCLKSQSLKENKPIVSLVLCNSYIYICLSRFLTTVLSLLEFARLIVKHLSYCCVEIGR